MSQQGWEKLLCSYFYTICLNVLSAYFSNYGFLPVKNKVGGVTFRNDDIFIEISYDPETYPTYSLTVVVGIGVEAYDEWGRFTGIPIWSIISEDDAGNDLLMQTFSNESELSDLLAKIQVSILDNYAKPLWENRNKLEKKIKKFSVG